MTDWINLPENFEEYDSFVYCITNTITGEFYIGQKRFWTDEKKAQLKTQFNKADIDKESKLLMKFEEGKIKTKTELKKQLVQLRKDVIERNSKKKNKRHIRKQSDFLNYWGSSESFKENVKMYGKQHFERKIIYLCKTKSLANLMELKEQLDNNVLFTDKSHNRILNVRINQNMVQGHEIPKRISILNEKLCECGHEEGWHRSVINTNCESFGCECKKFKGIKIE